MAFKGPGPGRPKGVPNKATTEMKELARAWTTGDPEWVESARIRMKEGKAPHLENYMLGMAHGVPKKVDEDDERSNIAVTVLGILQAMPPQVAAGFAKAMLGAGEAKDEPVIVDAEEV